LAGIAGEDSVALSWQQEGDVDFWTVYIDPLDGTETIVYRTTSSRFEVTDLAVGDHEVGVVSWLDDTPCLGPGLFIRVSVLGRRSDSPPGPSLSQIAVTATNIDASWDGTDAVRWDVRLVAADRTVQRAVSGLLSPQVSFTELRPNTLYGVQARSYQSHGAVSSWNTPSWQRTRKDTCARRPDRQSQVL
jgi:hypothetical protein